MRQCAYEYPDGRRCIMRPLRDGTLCVNHAPEMAEKMRATRSANCRRPRVSAEWIAAITTASQGEAHHAPAFDVADIDLGTAEGLRAYLARALACLAARPFTIQSAHAMGQLVLAQLRTLDVTSMGERLAAVEETLREAERRELLLTGGY